MSAKAVYVNGKRTSNTDVYDRALQFGDGLFETIAVKNSKPALLELHLSRLNKGLQILNLQKIDIRQIEKNILSLCKNHPDSVLKLIISRGNSAQGYLPDQHSTPNVYLYFSPFTFNDGIHQLMPVQLGFADRRLGNNPSLAGIKHLNRIEQVLGKIEAQQKQLDDCLMLDQQDHVIESTSANVFIFSKNQLFTPSLDTAGIAGVVRQLTLDIAAQSGIKTIVQPLSKTDFVKADAVFLTNAIKAVMPVGRLEKTAFIKDKWPINLFQEILNRVYT